MWQSDSSVDGSYSDALAALLDLQEKQGGVAVWAVSDAMDIHVHELEEEAMEEPSDKEKEQFARLLLLGLAPGNKGGIHHRTVDARRVYALHFCASEGWSHDLMQLTAEQTNEIAASEDFPRAYGE